MKGQITVVNILALFVALILYLALLPTINERIDSAVSDLQTNPNDTTNLVIATLRLIPFFFILAIVLTALNYAIPERVSYVR